MIQDGLSAVAFYDFNVSPTEYSLQGFKVTMLEVGLKLKGLKYHLS